LVFEVRLAGKKVDHAGSDNPIRWRAVWNGGIACLGWASEFGITLTCDQTGFVVLLRQVMLAIIANQSIYSISPHRTGQGHQEAAGLSQFDDGTGGGS
jgi:hypothetical protein